MNVKAIEHVSDLFHGNNLGTLVNHVVHGMGATPCFRPSSFLHKLFLTRGQRVDGRGRLVAPFWGLFGVSTSAPQVSFSSHTMIKPFKNTLFCTKPCTLFASLYMILSVKISDEFRKKGTT